MLCDIYSLGVGPVCVEDLQKVFGLNNLQVLKGYASERIPPAALKLACGPLGKWTETPETPFPLMEIVYSHQGTKVWIRLPKNYRTPEMQGNGTPQELEVVPKGSLERAMYPEGVRPLRLKMPRPSTPEPAAPDISKILPDFIKSLELGLSPRPATSPKEKVLDVPGAPKIVDYTETVMMDGQARRVGPPDPNVVKPEPALEAAPDGCCKATKANGSRCLRPGTKDGFCGAHAPKKG